MKKSAFALEAGGASEKINFDLTGGVANNKIHFALERGRDGAHGLSDRWK